MTSTTLPLYAAIASVVGLCALLGLVGADARWLAALGRFIVAHGVPHSIPFASAPAVHWHDVTALGQLTFWALDSVAGDRGLMLAQLTAVAIACVLLARDARAAGASPRTASSALLLAALGAAPTLAVARAQLFSIALFPLLLMLLRAEARSPSRRIWLLVPLIGLWSNLHGGVLAGVGVAVVYLLLGRLSGRPRETVALLPLLAVALCANPGGVHALAYYHGVLSNQAAARGEGMWGPISLTSPFDLLLVLCAALLGLKARRARLALWEVGTILLLAGLTLEASRSGVWLVFMLVTPAALGTRPARASGLGRIGAVGAGVAIAAGVAGMIRGPLPDGASAPLLVKAIALAGRTPILASDIPAEQVALAGGRVWASDPIDAFESQTQLTYLEWADGSERALSAVGRSVRVVLVSRGSPAATLMSKASGFALAARDGRTALYVRTGASRPQAAATEAARAAVGRAAPAGAAAPAS